MKPTLVAGCLVALLALPALADPPAACRRLGGDHLGWVHVGAFVGETLVLGDSTVGGLHALSPATGTWTIHRFPGDGPLEFDRGFLIGGGESKAFVSVIERLVELDSSINPVRGYPLAALGGPEGAAYFFHGAVGQELNLLGYLEVVRADGTVESGVARVKLGPIVGKNYIRQVGRKTAEFEYYRAFLPFAAALGDRLFWLVMESPAHLVEATADASRRHQVVPTEWRTVPAIRAGGPESTVQDFARLERQSFLAGLFGQGRELFILYRSALPAGGARWQLEAVDPDHPERSRRLILPTTSPWITLVAGPQVWALLAKGPVDGAMPSHQTTTSVLLLPANWFTAPASPLTREPRKDLCP